MKPFGEITCSEYVAMKERIRVVFIVFLFIFLTL